MREEYIEKVKAFIQSQTDNEQGLAKIKEHVGELGATEEEFTEALRQVVFESMRMSRIEQKPHELMLQPDHALEEREVTLEERPPHTLVVQDRTVHVPEDTHKQFVPVQVSLDKLQSDIITHENEQLSAFQKELASTKAALIETFEEEMASQRQTLLSNQKELLQREENAHPVHKLLTSAPGRSIALALFLILGVSAIMLASSIQKPTESITHAAVQALYPADSRRLVPQVFASTETVDPEQVFSFPATNVSLASTGTPTKEVLGFFPYWMLNTQDKVSLYNLTALSLFGIEMDGKGNIETVDPSGQTSGGWEMYNDPKLTLLLARAKRQNIAVTYTLKMFDNTNIENLVRSDTAQEQFISNALHIMNSKNLAGINLDFEYVGEPPSDVKDGFTRLVTNLSAEMKRQVPASQLTIDTYVTAAADTKLFDIQSLSQIADALIIMGYDIHTPTSDPGPIAPMESEIGIIGLMQSYLNKVDPAKLILAVPYYGYDWTIPKTPDSQATIATYAEALDKSKSLPIQWDESAQSPYYYYSDPATQTNHEVYFENARSLGIKYDFVNQKNLKGIGIWALGYDGLNTDLQTLIMEKFGTTPSH